MSLGRKQRIDNSAWLEAVATIEEAVSRAELDELTAATVADIKAVTAGKCAAYAWSAGKDSIVLGKLCEAAGVTDSMIGVCDLEYPAFAAWIEEHKPAGCEVINTHQDINDFLAMPGNIEGLTLKRLFLHLAVLLLVGLNALACPAENFKISHSHFLSPRRADRPALIYSLQRSLKSLAIFSMTWAAL